MRLKLDNNVFSQEVREVLKLKAGSNIGLAFVDEEAAEVELQISATGGAGSGISGQHTLSTGSSAGATQVVLDRDPTAIFAGGSYVAVGASTTKCEIRRVTAVSGAQLTLALDLKYAHSTGESVWVLTDTWVTPEWFGCKANTAPSYFDSYAGLMQMFVDHALNGGTGYGITGHNARYYSTKPLAINDFTYLQSITLSALSPYGIDPLVGTRVGEPDQFFVTLAGQFVTVTSVNTSTNEITLSASIGSLVGERLILYPEQGSTLPAPLEIGRTYYVVSNPSGTIYTISLNHGGAAIDLTTTGSGKIYGFSTGGARMRWEDVTIEGNELQGCNGLIAYLQQPSYARSLRVEGFPGPKGVAVLSGQQAYFENPMFIDGSVGIRFQNAQFMYLYGVNVEDCDKLCIADSLGIYEETAAIREINFYGGHWESAGIHTSLYQTIVGNASVTGGTFTISFKGQTTAAINYNASAATIQTELEALSTINPGDVAVTAISGGLPGGSMEMAFSGQYAWKTLTGTEITTVNSSGLTGGTYSRHNFHPGIRVISIKKSAAFNVFGSTRASGGDFLTLESTALTTDGYLLMGICTTGQEGYAVNDIPRGIQIPWTDSGTGAAERLNFFSAGGGHGGTEMVNWYLAGRLGGYAAWSEYDEEFRLNGAAKLRFGDTGPLVRSGSGTPEAVVTAPIGSLYVRTDGGAATSLYVKESGTGNTGWVGK